MIIHEHSVSWYAAKIERREPFAALSYGDGEFMVASGRHVGRELSAAREVVTPELVREMRASFEEHDEVPLGEPYVVNEILRGSDASLLDPSRYKGRDVDAVRAAHDQAREWIARVPEWVDGTVWDVAAREGKLGPLVRVLRQRKVIFIGSEEVGEAKPFGEWWDGIIVPPDNAAAELLDLAKGAPTRPPEETRECVFVACCGLAAIPLLLALRRKNPHATFLDLGSALDVFARTGAERGWRAELYRDEAAWRECVRKNLED
jgi:hypothetical protein